MISISIHRGRELHALVSECDIGMMEGRVFFGGKFLPFGDPEKRGCDLYKGIFLVKGPKVAILEGKNVELPISRP
jgi:hypothetical protein